MRARPFPDRIVGSRVFEALARVWLPAHRLREESWVLQALLDRIFGAMPGQVPPPPVVWGEVLSLGVWRCGARRAWVQSSGLGVPKCR